MGRRRGSNYQAGMGYLFDRPTASHFFRLSTRLSGHSAVEGVAAATQPLPTKPAPFRGKSCRRLLSNRTPEIHEWTLKQFATSAAGSSYPWCRPETVVPIDGGAEWGSSLIRPAAFFT
jgi:hypothetical protein